MKKFLYSFVIILVLPLSFGRILNFEGKNLNKTLLLNNAFAAENKENQTGENIKPWEAYRGWAPSVPYGKTYGSKDEAETTKTLMSDEKPVSGIKEGKTKTTKPEEDSTKKEDNIKPWEAYRGWAPAVPYGN